MHPYLFEIPLPFSDEPFRLRSFGVLVAAGFLLGAHLLQRFAARYGDDPEQDPARFSRVAMWVLLGIFGGARLMYVGVEVLRGSETGQSYLADPLRILYFWEGGLVMYGGFLGGVLVGLWSARREGIRPMQSLDLGLAAAFFGQAVGRIGCLMVGDDYGSQVPEDLQRLPFPLTLRVPDPLPEGSLFGAENAGQVLWATQVWMSVNALLIGLFAWRFLRRRRYAGQVGLWVILVYALTRFVIEMFRGDSIRGLWLGGALSTSQLLSIVAGLGAGLLLLRFRGRQDAPRPAAGASAAAKG